MAPAEALELGGGVCTLHIEVTSSEDVPLVPDARTWNLDGEGTCATTTGIDLAAMFNGHLSEPVPGLPTVGCASAVLEGEVTLTITGLGAINLTAVAVVAGTVIELTGVRVPDVVGEGVFVQNPNDTVACASQLGIDDATWCGVFAFVDPRM
jgi:ABC-type uncharacterized transport system permease subunit